MVSGRHIAFILFFALLRPALGREAVYLKSGFSFEADSHASNEQTVVVQLGSGTVELPLEAVLRIEALPEQGRNPNMAPGVDKQGQIDPEATGLRTEDLLNDAAYNQGIDEAFVRSVAKVESDLRLEAVSPKGALGLMQLMPATAAGLGVDPKRPHENALGGARYLRELLIRYKGNTVLALAAYNAGPEAVAKYHGVPPYSETRRYINAVLREYQRQSRTKSKSVSTAQLRSALNE